MKIVYFSAHIAGTFYRSYKCCGFRVASKFLKLRAVKGLLFSGSRNLLFTREKPNIKVLFRCSRIEQPTTAMQHFNTFQNSFKLEFVSPFARGYFHWKWFARLMCLLLGKQILFSEFTETARTRYLEPKNLHFFRKHCQKCWSWTLNTQYFVRLYLQIL